MPYTPKRNPFVVALCTAIGAGIRYFLFNMIPIIRGEKPKKSFDDYGTEFRQIVYSILLALFIIFGLLIWVVYIDLQSRGR